LYLEAALNALDHLDIEEPWTQNYNKMKAAARETFPNSKLFPHKDKEKEKEKK
jgi:hypothetical protein